MNLFLWMEDQKLMGNDPFLALVAEDNNVESLKEAVKDQEKIETEKWFEDDDAEEESSDDEYEAEDGDDEADKDMELFYFTTALDVRLCSVKKKAAAAHHNLWHDLATIKKYNKWQIFFSNIIDVEMVLSGVHWPF